MKVYDQALADFRRAVDLDPGLTDSRVVLTRPSQPCLGETLTPANHASYLTVDPNIIVTPVVGVAVAVQAATIGSNNVAVLIQNLHVS